MRLYLAATIQNGFCPGTSTFNKLNELEKRVTMSIPHRLDSYHYLGNQTLVDRIRDAGLRVFLDSGAFSAFTLGKPVDIQQYCQFIKDNRDILEVYSVLDAIGDADQSWRNQRTMEAAGLQPLPCFHYGEPLEVLEYYAANYPYITLGGMVPISNAQLLHWLDHIWAEYLTDTAGRPKVRVHGFGLTSKALMERYPWYSVDSSSWVQIASLGGIYLTQYGNIAISDNSPKAKEAFSHFDNMRPHERQVIADAIVRRGFEVERLRLNHLSRKAFNIWTYIDMGHQMADKELQFTRPQPVLFT